MTSTSDADGKTQVAALKDDDVAIRFYDWSHWAYQQQTEPAGDWTTWLFMGGRGCGKTRTGAEWVRGLAEAGVSPIALVGETMSEALAVMVMGESGIMNVSPARYRPKLRGHQLTWPNGVEATLMSASDPDRFRGPQFAAAWCDEAGCGAVDKGANQPNIFGDAKSAESGRPYFSSGEPDPLIQRQVLRAHHAYWRDPLRNPTGMVDVSRLYAWTWDARPYPAFPALTDVWSDGPNHGTGHWLTGRLGALASDELAAAIAADHGVSLSAEPASPLIAGYVLNQPGSGREALEPLMGASGLVLRNHAGNLHLGAVPRAVAGVIALDDLAMDEGATLTRRRSDPAEAPGRLALTYQDRERHYQSGTVTALALADGPLAGQGVAMSLDAGAARLAAERLLAAAAVNRETVEFALSPAMLAYEPGDVIELAGLGTGALEIVETRDGTERRVIARTVAGPVAVTSRANRPMQGTSAVVRSVPVMLAAHLPPLPAEPGRTRLVLAGYAHPWPGSLQVVDDTTGASLAVVSRRCAIGRLATALPMGPAATWDRQSFEIEIQGGHLADVEPLAALAGSNRIAVQTASGQWEVIGFAEAELVSPGRYRLARLLRGLDGTSTGTGPVNAAVFVLDGRAATLTVEPHRLGEARQLRVHAGSSDLTGQAMTVETGVDPALPMRPVHLRAHRLGDGSVLMTWMRQSRAQGDGWGPADAPLEHVPERYHVRVLDGVTEKRSFEVAAPTASYSSAEQTADFGTLPTSFTFTVAQVSPVLGAGHVAQGELA